MDRCQVQGCTNQGWTHIGGTRLCAVHAQLVEDECG